MIVESLDEAIDNDTVPESSELPGIGENPTPENINTCLDQLDVSQKILYKLVQV